MSSGDRGGPGGNLLRLIPPIRRAREFRLYTEDGRRLVDLWQGGGAALLGHTPPGVLRELKNTAERGLFVPLPSRLEGRFIKALSRLFPGRVCRFYADEQSLERALDQGGYGSRRDCPDPAMNTAAEETSPAGEGAPFSGGTGSPKPGHLSLWRPFLCSGAGGGLAVPGDIPVLIPILPWSPAPRAVVLEPALADRFPPSDIASPALLAAATRGIHDLIAAAPERGIPRFSRIDRALNQDYWRRRGIYLCPRTAPDEDAYAKLFLRFLEGGFLPPPSPKLPLILPGVLSPGEELKLAGLLSFPS